MRFEILSMWSPDLPDPSTGSPDDPRDFSVFVQFNLGEVGKPGCETFSMMVCSANQVLPVYGGFVVQTLVLDVFDWTAIRDRVHRVLRYVESAEDWGDVIYRLSPFMRADDHDVLPRL